MMRIVQCLIRWLTSYTFFAVLWLGGCIAIATVGLHPYRHYGTGQIIQLSVFSSGLVLCYMLYSLGFISYFFAKKSPWWHAAPYSLYLGCSSVLLFSMLIVLTGAMHAPPYWFTLAVSLFIVSILHFVIFPSLLALRFYLRYRQKKLGKQNLDT